MKPPTLTRLERGVLAELVTEGGCVLSRDIAEETHDTPRRVCDCLRGLRAKGYAERAPTGYAWTATRKGEEVLRLVLGVGR